MSPYKPAKTYIIDAEFEGDTGDCPPIPLQAMFLNEVGKTRNLLTADSRRFTRIRFLEFKRMGASGYLFSPGSFGKRT